MPTLNLGMIDVPYAPDGATPEPKLTKNGRVPRATARRLQREHDGHDTHGNGPATTVSVAQILESKYGVMAAFYSRHEDEIGASIVDGLNGALEDLYAGVPIHDPFSEAGQAIAKSFRTFLMTAEIETMGIAGVPTKAAIDRRSSRFKSGKGPSDRPSFIDTGTMEGAFAAWVSTE